MGNPDKLDKLLDSVEFLQLAIDEILSIFEHLENYYLDYARDYLKDSRDSLGEFTRDDRPRERTTFDDLINSIKLEVK